MAHTLASVYKTGIQNARKNISDIVLKTPLLRSNWLSKKTSCNVFLKMESEQWTRSFKLRGASNKFKLLAGDGGRNRFFVKQQIITASSGNHGLACAYLSSLYNVDLTVYTYKNIAKTKENEITQYYNVKLIKFGDECQEAEVEARRQANAQGLSYISNYNDIDVICGQGTIAVELLEDLPELDAVFVPVGGGSLISGIAAYLKCCKPSVKIVGCQPVNDSSMYDCVKAGSILSDNPILDTFSSGTAGRVEPGSVTFDICKQYVDEWVLLEEEEIELAVFEMLKEEKKVVEGAAGVVVAAIQKVQAEYINKNVVIIVCGANIGVSEIKRLVYKYC